MKKNRKYLQETSFVNLTVKHGETFGRVGESG